MAEFLTGSLLVAPRRLGRQHGGARPGGCKIDEEAKAVRILRVDHEADVYRSR